MQLFTSKNTSVNKDKFPKLYNTLNWKQAFKRCEEMTDPLIENEIFVLDYGCGKYTNHLRQLVYSQENRDVVHWIGYDSYNMETIDEETKWFCNHPQEIDIFVCSNVLNVINDEDEIFHIIKIASQAKFFFFTVYEGDKTEVGKVTKTDCWQRNEKVKSYLRFFSNQENIVIRKGVITNAPWAIK